MIYYIYCDGKLLQLFIWLKEVIMDEKNFMTEEGLQRLKERLDFLKLEKRQEVAKKIAEARSYGDLSENNEYELRAQNKPRLKKRFLNLKLNLNRLKL